MKVLLISVAVGFGFTFAFGLIASALSAIHLELTRIRITTQAILDVYCETGNKPQGSTDAK